MTVSMVKFWKTLSWMMNKKLFWYVSHEGKNDIIRWKCQIIMTANTYFEANSDERLYPCRKDTVTKYTQIL